MRQLVYQVSYTGYDVPFYLWLMGSALKHCKAPKYYYQYCSFGYAFVPFDPNSGCQSFFSKIWLRQSLDIMVRYHHVQYQKKTNDPILTELSDRRTDRRTDGQTVESDFIGYCPTNIRNLVLGSVLAPLTQIWAQKIYFHEFYLYQMLNIVASYHCMQYQRKLINQTWENDRKPSFGPDFGPFGPNLVS